MGGEAMSKIRLIVWLLTNCSLGDRQLAVAFGVPAREIKRLRAVVHALDAVQINLQQFNDRDLDAIFPPESALRRTDARAFSKTIPSPPSPCRPARRTELRFPGVEADRRWAVQAVENTSVRQLGATTARRRRRGFLADRTPSQQASVQYTAEIALPDGRIFQLDLDVCRLTRCVVGCRVKPL
jgi:hypothetical protein